MKPSLSKFHLFWLSCLLGLLPLSAAALAAPSLGSNSPGHLERALFLLSEHAALLADGPRDRARDRRSLRATEQAMRTIERTLDSYFHADNLLDSSARLAVSRLRPIIGRALGSPPIKGYRLLKVHHESIGFDPRLHRMLARRYAEIGALPQAAQHLKRAIAAGAAPLEVLPDLIDLERTSRPKSAALWQVELDTLRRKEHVPGEAHLRQHKAP